MTQDRRTNPEHGHLKDSLKKQGRSDQLAEKIAEQTVTQAGEKMTAERASPAPVQADLSENNGRQTIRSPQASQGTPKEEEAAKAQRRRK